MRTLLTILTVIVTFLGMDAQPVMQFDTLEHDFGQVKELGGIVQHRFVYKNIGDKPLIINRVHTSCGCTSPAWSKEPVLPGRSGYIDVSFDPRDRPGSFTKSIIVSCNAKEESVTLYITGSVTPRPEPLSSSYPYAMEGLRLKATTVNFNKIAAGQTGTKEIEVVNPSKANIVIAPDPTNTPPYFQVSVKPSILKPGEKGTIKCTFNTAKFTEYDYVTFDVPILVNTYSHDLHTKAIIHEVFTEKTKKKAPVLELENRQVDLGDMASGEVKKFTLTYRNTGIDTLKIRAVRNACDCIALKIDTPSVPPGGEGRISAVFDSEGRTGKQDRYLTIISNSPTTQQTVCRITANITDN